MCHFYWPFANLNNVLKANEMPCQADLAPEVQQQMNCQERLALGTGGTDFLGTRLVCIAVYVYVTGDVSIAPYFCPNKSRIETSTNASLRQC